MRQLPRLIHLLIKASPRRRLLVTEQPETCLAEDDHQLRNPRPVSPRTITNYRTRDLPHRRSVRRLFCFDSCISIPLHGARRAMAAALPLPPAGQRRHFRGISARPGPACAVIVGLPPSTQKQKRKTKEKAHDAPRRKQKKTNLSAPPGPLLLHLLRGDCRLHFNLHAAPLLRRRGAWGCCHGSLWGLGPSLPSWRGW